MANTSKNTDLYENEMFCDFSNGSEIDVEWTDEALEAFLAVCQKRFQIVGNVETDLFWQGVNEDFNVDVPLSLLKEKFHDLSRIYNAQHGKTVNNSEWLFDGTFLKTLLNNITTKDIELDNNDTSGYEATKDDVFEEASADEVASDPDYAPDRGIIRWSRAESSQLINSYIKNLPRLLLCQSLQAKGSVWNRMADEIENTVESAKHRGIEGIHARQRFAVLKKKWEKHINGTKISDWSLFDAMSNAIMYQREIEERLRQGLPLDDLKVPKLEWDPENIKKGLSFEERVPKVKLDTDLNGKRAYRKTKNSKFVRNVDDEEEPVWFTIYREAANKRHEEKMRLKNKLLQILEEVLQQM